MKQERQLTIEDLNFRREGRSVPQGSHLWRGKMITDYVFKEEYVTKIGKFKPEEWNELAMQTVIHNNQVPLYEAVAQHAKRCPWLKNERERMEYALSCMTHHAYEHWDDFITPISFKETPNGQLRLDM